MTRASPIHHHCLTVATVLALVAVLAACGGGEPAPAPEPTDAPAATPAETAGSPQADAPTRTATAPHTATPADAPPIAELGLAIEPDTRWGDLFATLIDTEQSCFREEFGDGLEEVLARPLLSESETQEWEVTAFSCLAPETARAVWLEGMIAGMADDGFDLGDRERACLRETVAGADVAALIAAEREGDPAFDEFVGAVFPCLPNLFLETMLTEMGLDVDALGGAERACLEESLGDLDWVALGSDDPAEPVRLAIRVFACVPALFVASITGDDAAVSEGAASCLREAFDALDVAALIEAEEAGEDDAEVTFGSILLGCLPGLFLADTFGVELELDEREASCLRESFSSLDWAGAATTHLSVEVATSIARCVPDLFLTVMLAEIGAGPGDVSEGELGCLREWASRADAAALLPAHAAGDEAVAGEFAAGVLACAPALFILAATGERVELGEEAEECLRDLREDPDAAALTGSGAYAHYAARLLTCVPGLGGQIGQGEESGEDDHADTPDGATPLTVGEPAEGVIGRGDRADYFFFEAETGQTYELAVELGTLTDSVLALYNAGGVELAFNDDSGDSLASRLRWTAPAAGRYYVEVWGFDWGSYTLTVSRAAPDDHADSLDAATRVAVGEPAPGVLDDGDDSDYFAFEAEAGVLYQVDVALGTLRDSALSLYDAGGRELAYNDDHGDSYASRIYWEATDSGTLYLEVWGFDWGSYTLTVIAR